MRISDWSSDVCSSDLHQHTSRRARDAIEQPGAQRAFRSRRLGVEHVGRIADQREHALVADRVQRRGGRGRAQHRRLVELPVAGMEDAAIRRLDQQRVALGNRVRSEEHTSELQSLMRISYAVFCLKKKKYIIDHITIYIYTLKKHI